MESWREKLLFTTLFIYFFFYSCGLSRLLCNCPQSTETFSFLCRCCESVCPRRAPERDRQSCARVRARAGEGFYLQSRGRRRGHVPKITKSVWQLTVFGFWLKFVDMTSSWVRPKRTPGIPGCLPALQTEQPVTWQNRAVRAPSPPRRPYLPAESPIIRVWPTCGRKEGEERGMGGGHPRRAQCHGRCQLCSHFAHRCNRLL